MHSGVLFSCYLVFENVGLFMSITNGTSQSYPPVIITSTLRDFIQKLNVILLIIVAVFCKGSFYFFLELLGFELGASHLTRKALYHLSHASNSFCPGWPGLQNFYFKLLAIAGMTGAHHHTQLLVEMGSCYPPELSLPSS
jgi:hypothetical protein